MEIDEEKAKNCQADRRLEKPFDADHLRGIVTDLVNKTKANPVSSFLQFPDMPDFEETPAEMTAPVSAHEEKMSQSGVFAIPEVEDPDSLEISGEEFSSVPLTTTPRSPDEAEEGGWAHQDLTKFKIQIPEVNENDFASKFVIPQNEDLDDAHIEMDGEFEEISFDKPSSAKAPAGPAPQSKQAPMTTKGGTPAANVDSFVSKVEKSVKEQMMETLQRGPTSAKAPTGQAPVANAKPNAQSKVDLDGNMMEKIIREEAREVIESICWKVLPEIAERIVREELNKLLKETEKNI